MQIEPNDPSLSDASAMLAEMEAAENAADQGQAPVTTAAPGSEEPAATAGQGSDKQVPSTTSKPESGTPAAQEPQKPQDKPTGKSKYAQAQERLHGSWDKLFVEREAHKKALATFESERNSLIAEKQQIEQERQRLSQPKYKPEDYDNAASQWKAEADALEAEGKFDEAAEKRGLVKKAQEQAKYLRDNPPKPSPTAEQTAKEFEAKRKEWYGKAVQDFPEIARKDSPVFQKLTETITKGSAGYDPIIAEVVNRSPEGMYYAARLVNAETCAANAETCAASVTQKDKEIVELRAKVKEFDEKAAIPADSVAQRQAAKKSDSEMSDDELEADVIRQAESAGGHRF
jgi:hypothetical protein